MFGWLAVVEYFFARPGMTLAHVHTNADGMTVMGRPVYTLRYIEPLRLDFSSVVCHFVILNLNIVFTCFYMQHALKKRSLQYVS